MNIRRNPIASAIKTVLYSGLIATVTLTSGVNAADDVDKEKLDNITVTGSNIRGVDLEGAHPVTIITREDLIRTGVTDVGDLLQRLPAFTGSPVGVRTNNGGAGSVRVDLRGIGSGRTLVLIDGRRTVDKGDFQTIPAAMIARVEILKEGATAIYGADAVAGVVNIITRTEFSGAEVTVKYSDSFDTDNADNKQFGVVFGQSNDNGHFTFGLDYEEQKAITQGDTPYEFLQDSFVIVDADAYREAGFDASAPYMITLGSSRIPCGRYLTRSASENDGPALTIDGNDPSTGDCGTPGRLLTPEDFRPYVGGGPNNDTYNYAPVNFIQTPYEKTNIFFNAAYDVTDSVNAYGSFRYNHRTSAQRLAPLPFDSNIFPSAPIAGGGNGIPASNVFNPFGEDLVNVRRRMVESNREFFQDVTQYQATIGAKGDIKNTSWSWDTSYNFGFRQRVDEDFGQFLGARLALALGPSFFNDQGVAVCGTPDNPVAGCVPLNLFGGTGTVTQEMLDYVAATLVDHFETQLDVLNVNFSGLLFDLPAGSVGSSIGFEYRDEGFKSSPDSNKVAGTVTGGVGPGLEGTYDVTSFFGELSLPLLDSDSIGQIDLTVGGRYDDYSTIGSNSTFQGSLMWKVSDSLLLRTTFAEVFREPSVGALFAGQSTSAPPAQDPCNNNAASGFPTLTPTQQSICIAQGVPDGGYTQTDSQLRSRVGGNPNLKPEQGETMTVGLAWSPDFLEGFTLALDWWSVDLDDGINSLDIQTLITACLNSAGVSSPECSNVARRANGEIDFVVALSDNAANVKVEGLDAALDYSFDSNFGRFSTSLQWTHLLARETIDFTGGPVNDFLGRYDRGNNATYNEDQGKLSVTWTYDKWTTSYHIDYLSGITADLSFGLPGEQEIGSQVYNDLVVSYAVPWYESTITVAVTNLFDKAPPFIANGFNATTDPSTYRMFGRSFSLRWNTRF